jgi:hypothetical protein
MFTKTQVSQSVIDSVSKILLEDDCVTPMQSKKIADKEVEKHEKHMHKGKKPTFEAKSMEEDKLKETGFHMAAHAAKKAGQPHFTFQGKKYPTTAKSTAESMDEASVFDYKANKDEKDPKFTTKKPGERTGHDSKKTEKGVQYTKKPLRSDGQEFKKEDVDFKGRLLEKAAKEASLNYRLKKLNKEAKDHEYSDPHMAVNQLKTIMTNAEELLDMLGDSTDLPEWVESKITLAEDYMMTVANYMRSELHEDVELDEELHPEADKVLKHIKPEHHAKYKPDLAKGVYKGDYADRSAVLKAAQNAGHLKEEVEQIDEGMMDTVKKVGGKVLKTLGHGSDADMRKDLQKKMGMPQTGEKPKKEAVDRTQATTDTLAGRVKGGKDNEHSSIKIKLKAEATEKHDDKPPFDGPYTKVKSNVKDKSGAVHTPMSRARHLAKQAMSKVKSEMMLGKAGGTSE